jgi:hypothetical protein
VKNTQKILQITEMYLSLRKINAEIDEEC